MAADVEAAAGETPRTWKAAALLLQGGPARWAAAHALAGAVVEAVRQTTRDLDLEKIAVGASNVEQEQARVWAKASEAAWRIRLDKAESWQSIRVAESGLSEYLAAKQVRAWAQGQGWGGLPDIEVRVPAVDHLPDDVATRGYFLAAGLYLSPEPWLSWPKNVQWPEGAEPLVLAAMPEGGPRYSALIQGGVYAETR